MTNETDLPQFAKGLQPVGQLPNPRGLTLATKKDSNLVLKHIMAHVKKLSRPKAKGKGGRRGRRGIESDNKVRFGKLHRYY